MSATVRGFDNFDRSLVVREFTDGTFLLKFFSGGDRKENY
jgi:hypothetical protein